MKNLDSKRVLVLTAGLALVVGAGGAVAASKSSATRSDGFLARVAGHLGISTEKLKDATKAAAIDQVDADLKAGRITKAQADAMKARIEKGETPLFFGGPHRFGGFDRHRGRFGSGGPQRHLSAAADYLGLSVPALMRKLVSGQSLADVAKAQDKSVDGLKKAILDSVKKDLDQAVKDGHLTEAQAKDALDKLESHIDDIVNGSFRGPRRPGFHWRQGPPQGGARSMPGASFS
ncbi:MAG TPA: hypothetical protein VH420_01875 [Gaiellaceae bacterium]